eukprot:Awhi_evm1s3280
MAEQFLTLFFGSNSGAFLTHYLQVTLNLLMPYLLILRLQVLLSKLGRHTLGKCCLNIKKLEDVDLLILTEIVRTGWNSMLKRYGEDGCSSKDGKHDPAFESSNSIKCKEIANEDSPSLSQSSNKRSSKGEFENESRTKKFKVDKGKNVNVDIKPTFRDPANFRST